MSQEPDPTPSQWRSLRLLMHELDDDIAAMYDEVGITELRPRYVGPLIHLGRHESMTIRELASAVEVTHSAMSQTVAAMRRAGWVEDAPAEDARTRRVRLSGKAARILPFLEAEWQATEAILAELDEEIPYPMVRVVRDLRAALDRRPFKDRLAARLAAARSELPQ